MALGKPIDDVPATSVYLEQITVAADYRREGDGRAMLAALEEFSPLRVSRSFDSTSTSPTSQREPSMRPRATRSWDGTTSKVHLCKRFPAKPANR